MKFKYYKFLLANIILFQVSLLSAGNTGIFSFNENKGYLRTGVITPDGSLIATGDSTGTIIIYAVNTGIVLARMKKHKGIVSAMAWSSSGQLASGGADGIIRIMDVKMREIKVLKGHKGKILSLAFSPDGSHMLSGGADEIAILWDLNSAKIKYKLEEHSGDVTAVAFHPLGRFIATGGRDNQAIVYKTKDGSEVSRFAGHKGRIQNIHFLREEARVVSSDYKRNIVIWDRENGELQEEIPSGGRLTTVSDDEKFLIAGDPTEGSDYLQIYELKTGRLYYKLPISTDSIARKIDVSSDGSRILVVANQKAIVVDAGLRYPIGMLRGHTGSHYHYAFKPGGKILASIAEDKILKIWDISKGVEQKQIKLEVGLGRLVWSPDGKILAARNDKRKIIFWNTKDWSILRTIKGCYYRIFAFSPDGKQIACSDFKKAYVFNVSSGKKISTLPFKGGRVMGLAWSPDGRKIALSGDWDNGKKKFRRDIGFIDICRKVNSRFKCTMSRRMNDMIVAIAWSPDNRVLGASLNEAKSLLFLNPKNLKTRGGPYRYKHAPQDILFSPNGRIVAVSTNIYESSWMDVKSGRVIYALTNPKRDGEGMSINYFGPNGLILTAGLGQGIGEHIPVWNMSAVSNMRASGSHKDSIMALAVTPDGKYIFSAGRDKNIKLWNLKRKTNSLKRSIPMNGIGTPIFTLSPNGKIFAASMSHSSAYVRWYSTSTGRELKAASAPGSSGGHVGGIWNLAIAPDNKRIAVSAWWKANYSILSTFQSTFSILKTNNGKPVFKLPPGSGNINSILFNRNGKRVYIGKHGSIKIVDSKSGRLIKKTTLNTRKGGGLNIIKLSPNGKFLAVGTYKGKISILDANTLKLKTQFKAHDSAVLDLVFIRNKSLASCNKSGVVRLWETDGDKIGVIKATNGSVWALAVSPDRRYLYSGGSDRVIKIWSLSSKKLIRVIHD